MIIAQVTGGLGNQFFQYAMARRLAEHHGTELVIDASSYGKEGELRTAALNAFKRELGLFRFRVQAREASARETALLRDDYWRATLRDRAVRLLRRVWPKFLWRASHIIERQYRFQPEALQYPDDVYLQGFWQSPKYFEDIAPQIQQELQPKNSTIAESAITAIEKLRQQRGPVVSLHVRRGDLAHAHETLRRKNITHGAPVTAGYIEKAMQQFAQETCFFVCSDSPKDILWCRENIRGENLEFSTAESDLWDLVAMQHCDHHIIANSTFSWWAAWLGKNPERRVIAPRTWSPPEASFAVHAEDLLPKAWETL